MAGDCVPAAVFPVSGLSAAEIPAISLTISLRTIKLVQNGSLALCFFELGAYLRAVQRTQTCGTGIRGNHLKLRQA